MEERAHDQVDLLLLSFGCLIMVRLEPAALWSRVKHSTTALPDENFEDETGFFCILLRNHFIFDYSVWTWLCNTVNILRLLPTVPGWTVVCDCGIS